MKKQCDCDYIAQRLIEIKGVLGVMKRAVKTGDGVEVETNAGLILISSIVADMEQHICAE
ncbi:hypothetical protein BC354_13245 [Vibrio cholerae]|nr:hypothetical protein [Vibrio cholerae]RGP86559.1 hypothetical protein BC354_13245 [Vibrio cholerae]RGP94323.1 hypothetical protein BC352_12900 [Vibrio cholerae]